MGFTADIEREGELTTSRYRLIVVAAAIVIPLANVLLNPQDEEPWIGAAAALVALAVGAWFLLLARRPSPPAWLNPASALLDVTLVSLANALFILAGHAHAATNGRVFFSAYLLALALGVLRHDRRLCILSGAVALLQYSVIVVWAVAAGEVMRTDPVYGAFRWDNQLSRLGILAVATIINVAIVRRSQVYFTASIYDPLTGLTNRRYAAQRLTEILGMAARHHQPVTLALVDLDDFKAVNDRWGHAAGDSVLRGTSALLRSSFRSSDLMSRYGGDEFVVALPEGDVVGAVERLERFREAFAASQVIVGGETICVTLSMGVAVFPTDGRTPDALMAKADERLYEAKRAGRDRVVSLWGRLRPAPHSA
jgi:two-component system cell cycle response regulator